MKVAPLTFPLQEASLCESYAQLLPSSLHSCLNGLDPFEIQSPVYGIGLVEQEQPVGIILATAHLQIHTAHIHSLNLDKHHANPRLARLLLEEMSRLLASLSTTLATFSYIQESPMASLLEKVFLEQKWQGPRPLIIECLFKRSDFNLQWWQSKNVTLEEGFEELLFKKITHKERQDLMHRQEQMSIPDYIFPLGREKNLIEYENSLALRYKQRIVGWMITHRTAPEVIRYSALYLEDDFSHTGYWLKLLIDALNIHSTMANAHYGLLEINLDQISRSWRKFIERRLFPQTSQISHHHSFWKDFNNH
ncbi:hypothetical protein [Neochlamydia sp. S13]|uniref:hypothetical protein n=1 Tax=Neochlamydia sp. S13 TaxID=1353976 RepID=UPI0005A9A29A|nr:hypothetical protein [Neochlamydia sp. S13]BBI17808.1 hypothetical protein NCS13_1_1613 [Neochlamydia sp. S13]